MPITIAELDNGLGIYIFANGAVTRQEFIKAHLRHLFQGEDKLKKIRYTISDWAGVAQDDVTDQDIKTVAHFCRDASNEIQDTLVAIAVQGNRHRELATMFKDLATQTGWEIRVCRSTDEAKAWIERRADEKYGLQNLTFGSLDN